MGSSEDVFYFSEFSWRGEFGLRVRGAERLLTKTKRTLCIEFEEAGDCLTLIEPDTSLL